MGITMEQSENKQNIVATWIESVEGDERHGGNVKEALRLLNESLGTKTPLSRLYEWRRAGRNQPNNAYAYMLKDILERGVLKDKAMRDIYPFIKPVKLGVNG